MAKPKTTKGTTAPEGHVVNDPTGHIPVDGNWYPAQVRPGVWQGARKWDEIPEGQTVSCRFQDNDVSDGTTFRKGFAMRYKSEAECQVRCDLLNKPRLEMLHSDVEDEDEG
jgi:hypothetical protein